ncbi:MAG: acylphosphatase [Candidatus Paceibacteria bacterium]|jgi:acylphosphatase
MIKMEAIVSGEVQNVRYRVFTQDSATVLDLVGSVENLSDGSVKVIAEGPPDVLKEFVEYLNEGSLQAKVASVSIDWGTASGTFDEFSVLH